MSNLQVDASGFVKAAEEFAAAIGDRLQALEARCNSRIETLEVYEKVLKDRLDEFENQHLESSVEEWVDEIKATQAKVETLEAEIAYQRKANSSWQTPIPYSHGQGLDIQGRIV